MSDPTPSPRSSNAGSAPPTSNPSRFTGLPPAVWVFWSTLDVSSLRMSDERGEAIELPHRLVPDSPVRLLRPVPLSLQVQFAETGPPLTDPTLIKGGETALLPPKPGTERSFSLRVAERIPEAVIAELRSERAGALRIKLRLTAQAIELGWDIMRRAGPPPQAQPLPREAPYVPLVFSMAGGELRDTPLIDPKPFPRTNWFIHAKTGALTEFKGTL